MDIDRAMELATLRDFRAAFEDERKVREEEYDPYQDENFGNRNKEIGNESE